MIVNFKLKISKTLYVHFSFHYSYHNIENRNILRTPRNVLQKILINITRSFKLILNSTDINDQIYGKLLKGYHSLWLNVLLNASSHLNISGMKTLKTPHHHKFRTFPQPFQNLRCDFDMIISHP